MPKKYGISGRREIPKFKTTYAHSRSLQEVYLDKVAEIISSVSDVTDDRSLIATLSEQVQQLRTLLENDRRSRAAMQDFIPAVRIPETPDPVNQEGPRAAAVACGYRDSAFALARVEVPGEVPRTTWLSRKLRVFVSWLES